MVKITTALHFLVFITIHLVVKYLSMYVKMKELLLSGNVTGLYCWFHHNIFDTYSNLAALQYISLP